MHFANITTVKIVQSYHKVTQCTFSNHVKCIEFS